MSSTKQLGLNRGIRTHRGDTHARTGGIARAPEREGGVNFSLTEITRRRDRSRSYLAFKRGFDLCNATLQLLLFAPLMLAAAALIKLHDGGPVFFRQKRITGGPSGPREFYILKFRTMVLDAEKRGGKITPKDDRRITPVGKWLRKLKIDEIPQLFNILKGEMSFVGPRPQTLGYVEHFKEHYELIHSVVPAGLTDLASVRYRNEDDQLSRADDPERLYLEQIMPEKIKLHHEYVQRMSLWLDLRILAKTLIGVYVG